MEPDRSKVVPGFKGALLITPEGVVHTSEGKIINPLVSLDGVSISFKVGRRKKSLMVRELVKKTFDIPINKIRIMEFLDNVTWVRVAYKELLEDISCKVWYQGAGTMQRDLFSLKSLIDTKAIFEENGQMRNRWRPVVRLK